MTLYRHLPSLHVEQAGKRDLPWPIAKLRMRHMAHGQVIPHISTLLAQARRIGWCPKRVPTPFWWPAAVAEISQAVRDIAFQRQLNYLKVTR